jgi:hypothetical protein
LGRKENLLLLNKSKILLIILIAVIIMSSIIIYAGHFLFKPSDIIFSVDGVGEVEVEKKAMEEKPIPITYRHIDSEINGNPQKINLLQIDLNDTRVEISPVLSYDNVFGFENLSEMTLRHGAYAAVNGGFFHEYGNPGGMIMINGSMVTNSTGKYPVFIINEGKADFRELKAELWVKFNGEKLRIDDINNFEKPGDIILYTPVYGSSNRAKTNSISVTIENGIVTGVRKYEGDVDIPENGMLLAFFDPCSYSLSNFPIKKGDSIKFAFSPDIGRGANALECGSWIVKNGNIVVKNKDEWIGVLTNHDPRTVVGLKDDSTVILLTVDGRQPGYSAGLTGSELGKLLIELGVRDAAMLDGGASTEMIFQGRIVNRPSFKGKERPLGGALLVKIKQ